MHIIPGGAVLDPLNLLVVIWNWAHQGKSIRTSKLLIKSMRVKFAGEGLSVIYLTIGKLYSVFLLTIIKLSFARKLLLEDSLAGSTIS